MYYSTILKLLCGNTESHNNGTITVVRQGGLESQNPVIPVTRPWGLDNQTSPRGSE